MPNQPLPQVLLDEAQVDRSLRRIAAEIVEQVGPLESLCLVGIRRGGEPVARRLAEAIAQLEGVVLDVGLVDIAFYRDDAATALPDPKVGPADMPFDPSGKQVVLVDDVLQTGRTVRAAMDHVLDYGRPARVWLAVLCDRGGRELPIAADFIGQRLDVDAKLRVKAEFSRTDGVAGVVVGSTPPPAPGGAS